MRIGKPINEIRKYLHQNPELSREENLTSDFIASFFTELKGYSLTRNLGYYGLIATRKFGDGPAIAFRAELDALPILEKSNVEYTSKNQGISHACGHDGHMSILLNLARKLEENPPKSGTVHFLFQSAEETGEGAEAMAGTEKLTGLNIDYCFALHNIPGLELGSVHSKTGSFACASVGFTAKINGKTAHAAHPEDAINPLETAIDLLAELKKLPGNEQIKDFALTTSISLNAGEKAFGTSPANAELRVTMRAALTDDLDFMMHEVKKIAEKLDAETGTETKIEFQEYFPAVINADMLDLLKKACENAGVPFMEMERPVRWSEDFSQFSKRFPILMFGLGSGINQPPLHAPTYNFPDKLIEPGSEVFYQLFLSQSKN